MSRPAGVPSDALRVALVDDEELARVRLRTLLADCVAPAARVVAEWPSAAAALQGLTQTRCDLLLLDIHMPGLDGLQLAERLRAWPDPPAVVFVTAHAEHALAAFEVQALDYLTKPVRRARLQQALARAAALRPAWVPTEPGGLVAADATPTVAAPLAPAQASALVSTSDAPVIVVHERGELLRVPVAEVLYLKAELKYVTLRTAARTYLLDDSLADLEERLAGHLLRVHRNALVAPRAVRALERWRAAEFDVAGAAGTLEDALDGGASWGVQIGATGEWLAVSRRQLPQVRQALAGR